MNDWLAALRDSADRDQWAVLVTVVRAEGSTPRTAGTKMVVAANAAVGTIGGGHLEFRALELARDLLEHRDGAVSQVHDFALGPSLGQCCGGHASILFERVSPSAAETWLTPVTQELRDRRTPAILTRVDTGRKLVLTAGGRSGSLGDDLSDRRAMELLAGDGGRVSRLAELRTTDNSDPITVFIDVVARASRQIALFGAGHVGKAIVGVFGPLPDYEIAWIDSREALFPSTLPANVEVVHAAVPADEVESLPPGAIVLVMTHSHALDYEIVEKVLKRGDFLFCGLIGSRTKRAQFIKRLAHRGLPPETIQRLTCPIGIAGIAGKHPAEIAVAVAAEILQVAGRTSRDRPVEEASA